MKLLSMLSLIFAITACTTGVEHNVNSGNAAHVVQSRSSLTTSLTCFEKEAARLPFRYGVEKTSDNWIVKFQVFGGTAVGWFDKGIVVNDGSNISFYADAADIGIDAFGLKDAVIPIMKTCS